MAITLVASAQNSGNSAAPTVTKPAGSANGDRLLIVLTSNNGGIGITDNNGGTPCLHATGSPWTQPTVASATTALFYRDLGAGEPASYAFTLSAANRWTIIAWTIRGQATTTFDVAPANGNTNTDTIPICPGITTVADNAWAFAVAMNDNVSTGVFIAYPAGWTGIATENTQQPTAVAYKAIPSAAATGSPAFTLDQQLGSGWYTLAVFSVAPAGAASPGPQAAKWQGPWTVRGNVLTTELDALAAGAMSNPGPQVDNTVTRDQYGLLELSTDFVAAPASSERTKVYMITAPNGTNFQDGSATVTPNRSSAVAVIPVRADTAAQRLTSRMFRLEPAKLKFLLQNLTTQPFPGSGSILRLFTQVAGAGGGGPFPPTGTLINVGDNLSAIVNAAAPGAAFTLATGTHRIGTVTPKNGQVFIGQSGAKLRGSVILTAWTNIGGGVYRAAANPSSGNTGGTCETSNQHPLCAQPEDLYVDNIAKTPVGSVGAVNSNTFYFDRAAHLVYIGVNPAGSTVEFANTAYAFTGVATDVILQNFTIEHYAPGAQHGAIQLERDSDGVMAARWLVENMTLQRNHGCGIRTGHNLTMRGCNISFNGQAGVEGQGDDMLVENNTISFNNQAGYAPGWEAGATKFVRTLRCVFRNNWVHHNLGHGAWWDIDNRDMLVESNLIEDNNDSGVFIEISYGPVGTIIRNNIISRNGLAFHGWLFGAGIQIAASDGCEIYGNTLDGNGNGITLIQQNRGSGAYGQHLVQNCFVHDNSVTSAAGVGSIFAGAAQDNGDNAVFTRNNRFEDNDYFGPGNWAWNNALINFATWQATGNDSPGGTYTP